MCRLNPRIHIVKPRDVEDVGGGDKLGHRVIDWHSPDTGDYMASIALLTGFSNGNSPLPRAKGDQGLQLRHFSAEARPICYEGTPLPPLPLRQPSSGMLIEKTAAGFKVLRAARGAV